MRKIQQPLDQSRDYASGPDKEMRNKKLSRELVRLHCLITRGNR